MNVSILDVTIRDGSYAINYQYSAEQVGLIAGRLDAAGIDYIEVSHGCGLGARENLGLPGAASDADYVIAAKNASKNAKIGVIAGSSPGTLTQNIDQIIDHIDFIRFAANCDNPRSVEANLSYALKKRPDLLVFMQMMRSTRRPKVELVNSAQQARDMGVAILYLVDTAGHFIPSEVEDIVSDIRQKAGIPVGFHGHNNLGLAVANTLAAIKAGAVSVDASLRGMGRAAGNAQLEALVSIMKRMGLAGQIDLDALLSAGTELIEPIMPAMKGLDSIDVMTADANIDLYPLPVYEKVAAIAGVDFKSFVREMGSDKELVEAGVDEMRRAVEKLGGDFDAVMSALGIDAG